MIKGFRQSFKGNKRTSASSTSSGHPSSSMAGGGGSPGSSSSASSPSSHANFFATEPPKKIIRALYDYRAQGPGEVGFQKGDFLYVIGNENNTDWYEAADPPAKKRGMVPVSYFEVVSRKDTIPTVPLNSPAAAALAAASSAAAVRDDYDTANSNRSSANSLGLRNKTSDASNTGDSVGSLIPLSPRHSSTSTATGSHLHNTTPNSTTSTLGKAGTATSLNSSAATTQQSSTRSSQKSGHSLYGVVLYDFKAEREDELQASAGESIIIIARSNDEWFVAKPIGRLGGPGLIPISFIEVRDVGTNQPVDDVDEAIRRANVPKVEEWKRMAAKYKASSIPLGKSEDSSQNSHNSSSVIQQLRNLHLSNGSQHANAYDHFHHQQQQHHHQQQQLPQSQQQFQPHQSDYYNHQQQQQFLSQQQQQQYLTHQQKQYYAQQSSQNHQYDDQNPLVVVASVEKFAYADDRYWYLVVAVLSNGRYRYLCRYYQDFYDFQVALLQEFPAEAGRTGKMRTLPFMPGPLTYVNDSISSQRRANLDEYVRNLIDMPAYISQSPIVQQLFAVRTGDIETNSSTPVMPQPQTRSTTSPSPAPQQNTESPAPTGHQDSFASPVQDTHAQSEGHLDEQTASGNNAENISENINHSFQTAETPNAVVGGGNNRVDANGLHMGESDSTAGFGALDNGDGTRESTDETVFARPHSPSGDGATMVPPESSATLATPMTSTASTTSTLPSLQDGSYIKIKVFHEDDLIAIRVPSTISFDQLSEKIAERLGLRADQMVLLYKQEDGEMMEVRNAEDFAHALGNKVKLILCAR